MKPKAVQKSKETKTQAPAAKAVRRNTAAKVAAPVNPAPRALETTTLVAAKIDVGFGNALFIRGEGDGLSWDKGTPLECVDGSTWVWSTTHARGKVTFKLLVNDQVWSQGNDLVVEAGKKAEVVPVF